MEYIFDNIQRNKRNQQNIWNSSREHINVQHLTQSKKRHKNDHQQRTTQCPKSWVQA